MSRHASGSTPDRQGEEGTRTDLDQSGSSTIAELLELLVGRAIARKINNISTCAYHTAPSYHTLTMALRVAPSPGFLRSFLAVAQARLGASAVPSRSILQSPVLERWQPALLPAITIPIPSLVTDIWESILRAVPKKKTSHMKKRHRQMAGKALKDVTALNTCSGCGRTKRAHVLCPYCVASECNSHLCLSFETC